MAIGSEELARLRDDIKTYLNITWTDDNTDRNVTNYIESGMSYLNGKYGAEADYTTPGMPRTLLFEYCRYFRDAALDVFENNYQALLLSMQTGRAVSQYVGTEEDDE